jgi:hypothetical protein
MKVFFMTTSNGCKAASTLRRPVSDIGHFGYFSRRNYYYYSSKNRVERPTQCRWGEKAAGLRIPEFRDA